MSKFKMTTHEELKNEVLTLAEEVGVKPNAIHIRAMKRKWASCSSKGRLSFNEILLDEPKEVRYKIILHELLHLKYPNHSKMFKLLLDYYLQKVL
ncbi:MAG TPA: M48 family metallopeptidase [Bacteroidales bacterium]|jgi:predicted metal-dependent hydrolase|nr:M48 family metallopeptidase [Bacteroidales bacterium]HOR04698.1 M48 family metallopeptidase [Bacteroidales bacterium]HPL34818.1 M48 family metallopeptidase [Bacteroidales bacterium]HQF19495.1 M48 family metallopeptidase [Bacteroidales bacterium]HQI50995.1 M48 family metallopeptidase [Bacteroidales bacterium]